MEGGALLQESFKTFAKDYVLFCHITTRIEGRKHEDLLEKKGGQGFPHIVFLDAKGNVIAKHEGPRNAAAFGTTGEKAATFLSLAKKAAAGDKSARVDYLVARVEMGHLTEAEAEAEAKKVGTLPADKEKAYQGALSTLAVREILSSLPHDDREKAIKAAGEKFAAMRKAGRPAPTADDMIQPYWMITMMHAEDQKDPKTFEMGLNALRKKFGHLPQAKAFFEQSEEKLKALQEEKK